MSLPNVGQRVVTTSPQVVLPRSTLRQSGTITNSGTVTVYLSPFDDVTSKTGYTLLAGNTLNTDSKEAVYAVVDSANGAVGVWDDCG